MYPPYDILINISSDVLFVVLTLVVLWVLQRRELGKARRFFGLRNGTRIPVFVSGFEHSTTATKHVVAAVEYEAAVELMDAFRPLSGEGISSRLVSTVAGLIGQNPGFLKVDIGVSPLSEITQPLPFDCLVLAGGPLRNTVTAFYMQTGTLFKFDSVRSVFLERDEGNQYQVVSGLWDVAILEKLVLNAQIVFIAFGAGERDGVPPIWWTGS